MKKILFVASLVLLFLSPFSAKAEGGSSSAKLQVDYALPYPGLLSDSPFYFLRATRDRIVSLLISDSYKKAEFDLLQADKRLSAGIYLANKGRYDLSQVTISKGENYFEEALTEAKNAKKQGQNTAGLVNSLYLSAVKHQQVLKDISEKSNSTFKSSFLQEEKRAQQFEKMAKEILSEK